MKRFISAFAIVLFALGAGLVAGEVALRAMGFSATIWYRPDPQLGWSLRPGAKGLFTSEGRAHVLINPAGFRDRSHDLRKPKDVYRIVVLGDSYAEAMQVEFKSTFWWQLQENLESCAAKRGRQVEVLNFGVSGYGTAQELLQLESTAIRYQPDLVLLAFTNGNDLSNNSWRLETEKDRPFYRIAGAGLTLDDSFASSEQFRRRSSPWLAYFRAGADRLRVLQLAHNAKNALVAWRAAGGAHAGPAQQGAAALPGLEPGTEIAAFAPPRDAAWEEAWTVTERLLGRMNAYATSHHARLAVTLVTHAAQVNPDAALRKNIQDALGVKDLFYIERRIGELGARDGFQVIPLAPELQRRAEEEQVYFHGFRNVGLGVGHWNENGHRAAAGILARSLCPGVG